MPNEIDRFARKPHSRDHRVIRGVQFDESRRSWIAERRLWVGVYIEYVFMLDIVNVMFVGKEGVEEQKAQISHARLRKGGETDDTLQLPLHLPAAFHVEASLKH